MDALEIMFSLITLMFLATGAFFLSKKSGVPYTILLVVVGLILIPVSQVSSFHYLQSFSLTPGLLFFVFLPTLIFESAYNMNIRNILSCFRSIALLSVVSLLISAFAIAGGLWCAAQFVGFPLPFSVTLLFGALISATDPVAVLALFKEYGAPKRLSLIFEGESLFNDGTSLALFLIILEILTKGTGGSISLGGLSHDLLHGGLMFITMVFGGIVFGALMGSLFSKLIQQVHDNEFIEITLTMIVAHSTFMLSEIISEHFVIGGFHVYFSSIIATVVSAMMVGNYGRYKISPSVLEYMEHFWGYFAFVANSVIFILIGLLFASLPISLIDILPIAALGILVVAAARALSIYPVVGFLNMTKKEDHIPSSWQHLLAWGSLRGALAVTMVLLIPNDFTVSGWSHDVSVKDFITALTISCIYFTLFVKGLTIGPVIKYFKLNALNDVEQGEYYEATAFLYAKLLLEVERFCRKGYITEDVYVSLKEKYENLYHDVCGRGRGMFSGGRDVTERVLTIYALAMAKHSLKTLFIYNEVSETVYKKILVDLSVQMEHTEQSNIVAPITLRDFRHDWIDGLRDLWEEFVVKDPAREAKTLHMFHRAHAIIMHKSIEEVNNLVSSDLEIFARKEPFEKIIARLSELEQKAKASAAEIIRTNEKVVAPLALSFAESGLLKAKKDLVEMFAERDIVTPKVRSLLVEEIEFAHRV